ncbi:GEVED domain-containing protein [Flavobacterium sp. DG1-102-2]|uniref:Ig-like domain-containing protein n=1 Tax=Flavobacterium sp. DG1-102-2 TaxID=3081663 RepID=UPI0029492AF9|nr:GEVED domain-containing protein [Flavobacterium sp. DG1-102-2]MDV6169143.1 GEVED domain-containing protein [Flavobacterium sp. DG1-102-2]
MKRKLSEWPEALLLATRSFVPIHYLILAVVFMITANSSAQCTAAPTVAGASNITTTSARINWNAVPDTTSPTYTLEVYTDSGMTASFGTYTAVTATNFPLTALIPGTTYYYRVKVDNTTCGDFSASNSFTAQAGYTPLDTTGYNADVIANGVGLASTSTNNSVDSSTSNYAYLCIDYKPTSGGATLTYGLPVSRSLNSPNVTGLKYILQDYALNNSLRLNAQNDFGVLTLSQPQMLSNLYLAVASGNTDSEISVEVQFADNTSQIFTGIVVTNWDGTAPTASPAIINNIGRVSRTGTTQTASTGAFKLFQISMALDPVNHTKIVNAIKITKTVAGADAKIPNIFAVSGKVTPACPIVASATAAATTYTSATFNWTLGTVGTSGSSATYTLEVYTDAGYTTSVAGSPFTGLTATSQLVTGLTLDTAYYYRVKANNGTCDSDYVTGTYTHAYCSATNTTNSNNITNFTTTGGYANITNSTTTTSYNNYTAQAVSKPAGTTFSYNGTKSATGTKINIYVDWNKDLDFDDTGETIATIGTGATTYNGTITIPAGTALGNYRLRLRSSTATTITPCGLLTNGDTEDYTISVVAPPADCPTPGVAGMQLSGITASNVTITVTAPTTAPSGYLLVRSTSNTLSSQPATGATYVVGAELGGGVIAAVGPTLTTLNDFVGSNTRYFYFLYTYNENGSACFGPKFSSAVSAEAITCAKAAVAATASNITANTARLNWSSIAGTGGTTPNYTVELYSDAALTSLVGSYTTSNSYYDVANLGYGATYYYRVKGSTSIASCFNDAWSATINFVALNSYTPLSVTGFNADVIANGTGIAKISTTNAVDAVNNSYIAKDYERISGTVTSVGLDVNRTLSNTTPAVRFLLADYGFNNALRLPAELQSGTLTLTQQFKVSDLYLAVTSGSGPSNVSAQVNFLDGTSQSTSAPTHLAIPDWFGSGSQLVTNIGRVNRTDNTGTPETGAAKVFYTSIAILPENQSKTVTSILLTKTSTGLTEPVPNIFAVSAKLIDECPSVATAAAGIPTPTTETVNWTAGTGTAATSYTVEVYTNANFTSPIAGSPFTGITALNYNLTALTPATQYYFRVKAINASCASAYVTGTFTTPCQAPAAPTAAAQTICGPATVANLAATGVTGATFSWYTLATGGTALVATATVETGTYYVSQTTNACESSRTTVQVTVNTVLAPTAAAQTFCPNTPASHLTATGVTGATFTWYATQGGAPLTGTEILATETYYVTQTSNGCTSPATVVGVTVATVNAPTSAGQTVCSGTTISQLSVTGSTGATFTWSSTQGGAALAGTTTLATGTYYVTQTVGSCTSTATTVAVTVTTTPAPTATSQTFCAGTPVSQLVATGGTGATFSWYTTQGGPVLAPTTVLASGTYYVTQTLNGCPSTAVPVTVTINTTSAPTAAATQAFCAGATVSQLAATGTNLVWSATQGGTALSSTATLATGTYYVTQTANGCISTATTVAVTINTVNAPEASSQPFCVAATASQLTATGAAGATFTWYAAQGGNPLTGNTSLSTGTYYVTQTVGSCTSTATAVSVTINVTPVPTASAQTFCVGATVSQLSATGSGLKWYASQAGVAVLPETEVLSTGTYFVTQTLSDCESGPVPVSVTINTTPAPTASAQTFCAGSTASELLANGTDLTWYASQGGSALTGTETLATGTYFVTQTLNGCPSIATEIAVTVNTTPAPAASAQTFCNGATASELSATGTDLAWYASENGNVLTGNELLVTGTYFVTQTLNGCPSAATEVNVVINTAEAPTATEQTFCEGATASELTAQGTSLTWYAVEAGNELTGNELLVTGTYYVTQTVGDCTSIAATVNVLVNAIPDAPTGEATQEFTEGSTVTDLEVNSVDGAMANWFVKNDADEYIAVSNDTALEDGTTYYVSQTVGTCTSDYLAVTVSVTAGRTSFDMNSLKVYPNPTRDIITIANNDNITNVKVITLLGQTVIDQNTNTQNVQIDLSDLAAGNYILEVKGYGGSANLKVVKF